MKRNVFSDVQEIKGLKFFLKSKIKDCINQVEGSKIVDLKKEMYLFSPCTILRGLIAASLSPSSFSIISVTRSDMYSLFFSENKLLTTFTSPCVWTCLLFLCVWGGGWGLERDQVLSITEIRF